MAYIKLDVLAAQKLVADKRLAIVNCNKATAAANAEFQAAQVELQVIQSTIAVQDAEAALAAAQS